MRPAAVTDSQTAECAPATIETTRSGLAAGINDAFRQGGIAVNVAGLGALLFASCSTRSRIPEDCVTGAHMHS